MRAKPAALKTTRELAGYHQARLARETAISKSYLSEIESGTRPGSPGVLKRIADVLGCSLLDIAELEEGAA